MTHIHEKIEVKSQLVQKLSGKRRTQLIALPSTLKWSVTNSVAVALLYVVIQLSASWSVAWMGQWVSLIGSWCHYASCSQSVRDRWCWRTEPSHQVMAVSAAEATVTSPLSQQHLSHVTTPTRQLGLHASANLLFIWTSFWLCYSAGARHGYCTRMGVVQS